MCQRSDREGHKRGRYDQGRTEACPPPTRPMTDKETVPSTVHHMTAILRKSTTSPSNIMENNLRHDGAQDYTRKRRDCHECPVGFSQYRKCCTKGDLNACLEVVLAIFNSTVIHSIIYLNTVCPCSDILGLQPAQTTTDLPQPQSQCSHRIHAWPLRLQEEQSEHQ